MSELCCESTRIPGRWPRYKDCGRPAKVTVNGKGYCGIHDPVKATQKADAKRAEWNAQWERDRKRIRLEGAAPDLLAALQEARAYVIDYGNDKSMAPVVERIDAAIAKATGYVPGETSHAR